MVTNPLPKVCIFDAFGTLFNLDIPLESIQSICGEKSERLLEIWRGKQLEYTWLRALMKNYIPFNQITKEALQFAMNEIQVQDKSLFEILMPVYTKANAYADVPHTLSYLKSLGIKIAILSNGTPEMLEAGAAHAGIRKHLDQLLSVEQVRTFKPDPIVYQMAVDAFSSKKSDFIFCSSNQWDIAGAGAFGFKTIWLNRASKHPEILPPKASLMINSMKAFKTLLS